MGTVDSEVQLERNLGAAHGENAVTRDVLLIWCVAERRHIIVTYDSPTRKVISHATHTSHRVYDVYKFATLQKIAGRIFEDLNVSALYSKPEQRTGVERCYACPKNTQGLS